MDVDESSELSPQQESHLVNLLGNAKNNFESFGEEETKLLWKGISKWSAETNQILRGNSNLLALEVAQCAVLSKILNLNRLELANLRPPAPTETLRLAEYLLQLHCGCSAGECLKIDRSGSSERYYCPCHGIGKSCDSACHPLKDSQHQCETKKESGENRLQFKRKSSCISLQEEPSPLQLQNKLDDLTTKYDELLKEFQDYKATHQ